MASLLENTSRIANASEDIKTSLLNKGAKFSEGEKIDTYSSKIDNLDVIIPGIYNVECYIRVDGKLISFGNTYSLLSENITGEDVSGGVSDGSEDSGSSGNESDGSEDIVDSGSGEDTGTEEFVGMDFIIIGSDGSTQEVTSREGGFIYLTLNYGVAYDVQPKEQNKYYATEHQLIYHRKEDGNYFATDYYFYTVSS